MYRILRAAFITAIVLLILTPSFGFAQTSMPPAPAGDGVVDVAQLKALSDAAKAAQQAYIQDSSEGGAWEGLNTQAKSLCDQLGRDLLALSQKNYSAYWTSPGNAGTLAGFTCTIGKPTYASMVVYDPIFHNKVWSMTDNQVMNATTYAEWQAKEQAGQSKASWFDSTLNFIFVTVANILASVLAGLAILALTILNAVVGWTTGVQAPKIVFETWTVVRDFMNLMFIVALIVMAIATIIRYEAYSYKRILRDLIIMAVLINFSAVIATTLISFSDTLIKTLVVSPQTNEFLGIDKYSNLIWKGFITGGGGVGSFVGQDDMTFYQGLGQSITKIIALVVVTVSLGAIALLMFVRLIGLWFLIMISPAAYALNILPVTKGYAKQWWDTLFKYLIWGPVAMFFFRIGFVILERQMNASDQNFANETWLSNLFVAAFIFGGFMIAKRAGMYGAQAITSTAEKYAKDGSKFATSAYGNFFWRGNFAKVPAYGLEKTGLVKEGTGKKWQEAIGRQTAKITNAPSNIYERYVDKPNKERDKLVKKQKRRTQILKGYFKDLNEEDAKKFSVDDFAYAMKEGKLSDTMLGNLAEHGNPAMKKAIAKAFQEGHIQTLANKKKLEKAAVMDVYSEIRKYMWRELGGRESDRPADFMADSIVLNEIDKGIPETSHNEAKFGGIDHHLLVVNEKRDYSEKADFGGRMGKSTLDLDQEGVYRKRIKYMKKDDATWDDAVKKYPDPVKKTEEKKEEKKSEPATRTKVEGPTTEADKPRPSASTSSNYIPRTTVSGPVTPPQPPSESKPGM